MAQYIDKSALIAEIKRLIDRSEYNEVYDYAFRDGNNAVCVHILNFLDTLEVKEVNLEKEYKEFINCDNGRSMFETAKYFCELVLKAKKGE